MKKVDPEGINRRSFLRSGAMGAATLAALGIMGCSPKNPAETSKRTTTEAGNLPSSWDEEADVVICGAGGAGLSAAIEASLAGANTLVLEKAAQVGGTTALSAGITQAAGTSYQKELTDYKDDTPEKHFQFWKKASEGQIDEEVAKDLAYGCPEVIRWYVEDLGLSIPKMSGQSHIPYDEENYAIRIHRPEGEGGALITAMKALADKNGARFETKTEVTRIIVDGAGSVLGVEAKSGSKTINVKANKGVVLCTANIDHNREMAMKYTPQQAWAMDIADCLCAPTNTGDGLRMAMQIGAGTIGMGGGMNAILDLKLTSGQPIWGLIFVNKAGVRYVCEDAHYAYKTRMQWQMEMQTDHPCYAVWGENNLENCRPWDATTIKEAIDKGIVISAPSLDELAKLIGVDAPALKNTIDFWNTVTVPANADAQFGRISGFEAIEGPTYYANRMRPEIMGPVGGLHINVEAQVLRPDGTVIPGLYAAGIICGGYTGPYYHGSGTSMAANAHFGRKAGKNAAAREV